MFPSIQQSFAAGELSPSLFGRVDLEKYHEGCSTLRNFFVNYQGGVSTRAGMLYIGTSFQSTSSGVAPRDIPFQYNINQGYVLEFGDEYMRIKYEGAYVTEAPKSITAITRANPAVITSAAHGYSNGDWVYLTGVGGMTEFNGLIWVVTAKTTNTFELKDMFGNTVSSASFPAYTSGGTAARVYTVVSPYAAVDLPYLKYVQSANTMTLCCVNTQTLTEYPPYDLQRVGNTNWVFTETTYASSITPPHTVNAVAQASTTLSTYYSYVVTAVDDNGGESIASPVGTVKNNDIAINAGSNTVTWSAVAGAVSYNIYTTVPSYSVAAPLGASFGYLGSAFGTQFVDTNITPDFTKVPLTHQNPFSRGAITNVRPTAGGSGLSQATIGYSITTSTGSGFAGTPIVVNGNFVAFLVTNQGALYAPGDTIAITTGGTAATGTYTGSGSNPTDGQTVVINGATWTFKTAPTSPAQTEIQGTEDASIQQLALDLAASGNALLTAANYSVATNVMTITYGEFGTAGNAFTLAAGTYGGAVSAATLTGGANGTASGARATLTIGPATGTYPATSAYFQQRRGYADSINAPDTYYFSKPGQYTNMDFGIPSADDDAIIGNPWAQQVNGIQWMIPMPNGLVVLTGNGGWQLNGLNGGALTPSSQYAIQQANVGCSALVPPILINSDILYVQSKNSIVRDLTYNFFTNIYMGEDKTILANHLFINHSIVQWAYAEEPYKVIWCVRDDGILLSFTWLKEQNIWGWARHDTDGFVVSVCTVTQRHLADIRSGTIGGPITNAVYVIVKRFVNGQWLYYAEQMDDRIWQTSEDCFCVDAGLAYPMAYPNAVLSPAALDGTKNITATNLIFGGSGYTAPVASAIDEQGNGTGATFAVSVSGGVITAVTPTFSGANYTTGATKIVITDSTGTGAVVQPIITNHVTFTASSSVFSSGDVGSVIRIDGGIATIVSQSGTACVANITQPLTEYVPNDPNFTPVPAAAGDWSLSVPTTVVTGLNHLEGKLVSILADGSVVAPQIVTNKAITLPLAASSIAVGLGYTCQLQTMYLEPPAQQSTAQGKRKLLQAVTVRVQNTRGISVGTNRVDVSTRPDSENIVWTKMAEIKERNPSQPPGTDIPLYTGDTVPQPVFSEWQKPGQVAIQTDYPLPATILAVIPEWTIGDTSA